MGHSGMWPGPKGAARLGAEQDPGESELPLAVGTAPRPCWAPAGASTAQSLAHKLAALSRRLHC